MNRADPRELITAVATVRRIVITSRQFFPLYAGAGDTPPAILRNQGTGNDSCLGPVSLIADVTIMGWKMG